MAKVIFTAWKTKSQLLEVRNEFYPPPTYAGPDLRSHGCAVVCYMCMSDRMSVVSSCGCGLLTISERSKLGSYAAMYRTMLKLQPC
mgnify:FL=1